MKAAVAFSRFWQGVCALRRSSVWLLTRSGRGRLSFVLGFDSQHLDTDRMASQVLTFVRGVFHSKPSPAVIQASVFRMGRPIAPLAVACADGFGGDSPVGRAGSVVIMQSVRRSGGVVRRVDTSQFRPCILTICPFGRPKPSCPTCGTSRHVKGVVISEGNRGELLRMECARCRSVTQTMGPPVSAVVVPVLSMPRGFWYPFPYVPSADWVWSSTA